MDLNAQQPLAVGTAGVQIFPSTGSALTPEQQEFIRRNREKNTANVTSSGKVEYGYIFTKNYIISSTLLVIVAIFVFGTIILLEL